MFDIATLKLPLLAITVAILWNIESLAPHFSVYTRDVKYRRRHALRNAALAIINGLLGIALLAALLGGSILFAERFDLGLLRLIELPTWLHAVLALLMFDCWMYWWHRVNHEIPFFWRFHRVHHSDPRMDVTTALRFHPGEIILSTATRLLMVNFIGLELWHLALYELVALPVVAFHHSNIALSRRIDNLLRWLIVTPWMHWVHHSEKRVETNSNYSSVLSIWDHLFGSYRFRTDPKAIKFGLPEFDDTDKHQDVAGMLSTPLKK